MKLYLIYRQFYLPQTGKLHLGGIENYILALAELFLQQGYQVVVLQPSRHSFTTFYAGIEIRGIDCRGFRGNRKKYALFQAARQDFNPAADWLIFATDSYFVPSELPRTIAIQHGVSWDKPGKGSGLLATVKSWLSQRKYLSYVRQCRDLVCVELAGEAQLQRKWPVTGPVRLLIARRFVDYRGIPLASRVVQTLLQRYPQLLVSFAGDGPLLPALQQQFAAEPRVSIFCYEPAESLAVHLQHHLVLLPSVGSEGTSLSLAEAMAAGCAVVTTNVGGLSNMVLDQHNGLICMPDEAELVQRLSQLIEAPDKAKQLALMAWQSAQQSFSKSRWQQDWLQLLANIDQRSAAVLP